MVTVLQTQKQSDFLRLKFIRIYVISIFSPFVVRSSSRHLQKKKDLWNHKRCSFLFFFFLGRLFIIPRLVWFVYALEISFSCLLFFFWPKNWKICKFFSIIEFIWWIKVPKKMRKEKKLIYIWIYVCVGGCVEPTRKRKFFMLVLIFLFFSFHWKPLHIQMKNWQFSLLQRSCLEIWFIIYEEKEITEKNENPYTMMMIFNHFSSLNFNLI